MTARSLIGIVDHFAFEQVVNAASGDCGVVGFSFFDCDVAIVEKYFAGADDFCARLANDDCGGFVDSNAQHLRILFHQFGHILLTSSLGKVLVDRDA